MERIAQANDADHSVAAASMEDRNFIVIYLGDQKYGAPFVPGATISVAGSKIAQGFKDRIKPIESRIGGATGQVR